MLQRMINLGVFTSPAFLLRSKSLIYPFKDSLE